MASHITGSSVISTTLPLSGRLRYINRIYKLLTAIVKYMRCQIPLRSVVFLAARAARHANKHSRNKKLNVESIHRVIIKVKYGRSMECLKARLAHPQRLRDMSADARGSQRECYLNGQSIADTIDRFNQFGTGPGFRQFPPQILDMRVYGPVADYTVVTVN